MKKTYEGLEMEVIRFSTEDIITTSESTTNNEQTTSNNQTANNNQTTTQDQTTQGQTDQTGIDNAWFQFPNINDEMITVKYVETVDGVGYYESESGVRYEIVEIPYGSGRYALVESASGSY